MSVFKRFSDILNSNVSAMLDKAEDPEKLVRMIITEMENTLYDVRRESAKTIADKKDMERQVKNYQAEIISWQQRAETALDKDRDDLAKQALAEKHCVEQAVEAQSKELSSLDLALARLENDIAKLQGKLNEAIARRKAIVARHETVRATIQIRKRTENNHIGEALSRFDRFEKRMDVLEAEVEAMDLGKNVSLSQQIDSLDADDSLNQELDELREKMKKAS